MIKSEGIVGFLNNIMVDRIISEIISLKSTAQNTTSILVTLRRTNLRCYNDKKSMGDEIEA